MLGQRLNLGGNHAPQKENAERQRRQVAQRKGIPDDVHTAELGEYICRRKQYDDLAHEGGYQPQNPMSQCLANR